MTAPLLPYAAYQAFAAGTGVEDVRLAGVVSAIRDRCGWHIAPVIEETFILDGPDAELLQLKTLRLTEVASVKVDGVEVTDFEWSQDGSLRRCYWTDRYRGVEVVASHGYATVPDSLKTVVLDAVSRAVAVPAGQVAEKMGPFEISASQGGVQFFEHELEVIDRYRLEATP
jgi:hypothetical protein